ncbi:clr5 domain-containing protein [Sarocladium implicatum]|nr:clr5 domain-containing protein [Sarocladium implicatum]
MVKNWEDYKDVIIDLYSRQGLKLRDVMRIMEDRHGFKASMRAYRQKFADWKVRKYRRHSSTLSTPSSSGASNSRAPMGQSFDNGGYRQDQDDQYLSPNQYRASHGSGWPTTRSYSTTTSPTDISVLSISTPLTDSGQASFTSVYPSHTRSPSFSGQLSPIPHQSLGQWGTASGTGTGHGYGVLASPVSMATTASPQQPYSPAGQQPEHFQSLYASSAYGQDPSISGVVHTTTSHGQSRDHFSPQGQHGQAFSPATPWNQLNPDYRNHQPQPSSIWPAHQQAGRPAASLQRPHESSGGRRQEDLYNPYRVDEGQIPSSSSGSYIRRSSTRNPDARYMRK